MTSVAVVQLDLNDDVDVAQRRETVRALLPGIDADVILLPELWEVGPFDVAAHLDRAVTLPEWTAAMADLAPGRVLHAGSFLERDGDDIFNTAVVFGPDGEVLATYRKIHLFGFDTGEAVTLTAGDDLVTVQTPLGLTGLATCYDLRFPEMFRALTDAGATAVLIPTGWPTRRISHWDVLTRARAVENQMWIVGANSTGSSGGVELGGHSVVVDPWGVEVGELSGGVLRAQTTPGMSDRARADFPVLRDRRL